MMSICLSMTCMYPHSRFFIRCRLRWKGRKGMDGVFTFSFLLCRSPGWYVAVWPVNKRQAKGTHTIEPIQCCYNCCLLVDIVLSRSTLPPLPPFFSVHQLETGVPTRNNEYREGLIGLNTAKTHIPVQIPSSSFLFLLALAYHDRCHAHYGRSPNAFFFVVWGFVVLSYSTAVPESAVNWF